MSNSASEQPVLPDVERIVVAAVGVTARALADVAPELTLLQWRVLVLIDQPDGIAVGAIAIALGAKIAAVSRLVGRLRDRGLLQTRRADHDARIILVSLSDAGTSLRRRVVRRRRDELRVALERAQLGGDSKTTLRRLASVLESIE